ncbi:QcrA and Rieske domain-containing protein [Paenibacillus sp. GYB003]|uniref:QcrA and Rieske domain-containing protein n=1 Tax=Paenibacillus sp. GYB003 TaxID=2994392 RepID=UPI002F96D06E
MNERFPKKVTRRTFFGTSGKLLLGAGAVLAGSAGLFYAGARSEKERKLHDRERPGNFVEIGELERLASIRDVEKVSYKTTIRDAWVEKSVEGFVYARGGPDGKPLIMSPLCTHLGCTVEPAPEAERSSGKELYFRCPCHGAEFDGRGNSIGKASLPGLATYKPMIADGKVYIDLLSPLKRAPI